MKIPTLFASASSALALTLAAEAWDDGEPGPFGTHDPSTVVTEKRADTFFYTGRGVGILRREGRRGEWQRVGSIFRRGQYPEWHKEAVPPNRGHLWAPDVIQVGERWLVYYSVSDFGKNTSAIGLASNATLDPDSRDYEWKDEGVVITSKRGDNFNAIDPAVVMDGDRLWMSFGSYWDGIMLVELDPKTGLLKDAEEGKDKDEKLERIRLADNPDIEAPFICKEGDWYYLFVNWGKCCRGVESTYEIRVGRSKKITGPYKDLEGTPMVNGGGSLVVKSKDRFIGPGHASIYERSGKRWLVHHFYDGESNGAPRLRMLPLEWQDGWPVVEN